MNKILVNKVTFVLNLIVLTIIFVFTIISFFKIDNEPSSVKKMNTYIEKKLNSMSIKNAISIEETELPEIENNDIVEPKFVTVNPVIKVSQKKLNKIDKIIPIKPKKTPNAINIKKDKLKTTKIKLLKNTSKDYKKNNHNFILEPINNNNLKNNTFLQSTNNNDKKYLIDLGQTLLNKNRNYEVEFLWPLNNDSHNKIYKILNHCLLSETVLMGPDNKIFGLKGIITTNEIHNKYSNIIRMPTNVYSSLEKKNISIINKKYFGNNKAKHLRLFRKNVDAFILGYYLKIALDKGLKIKKIKGNYTIINNELYLDKLMINSIPFKNRISLSSIVKECNV